MSEDSTIDKIREVAETVENVMDEYDEEIEKIRSFVVGDDTVLDKYKVSEMDPLTELNDIGDSVEIVMGPVEEDVHEVQVAGREDGISIHFAGKEIIADGIDDDVEIEDTEVELNNGVLTARIPKQIDDTEEE